MRSALFAVEGIVLMRRGENLSEVLAEGKKAIDVLNETRLPPQVTPSSRPSSAEQQRRPRVVATPPVPSRAGQPGLSRRAERPGPCLPASERGAAGRPDGYADRLSRRGECRRSGQPAAS